jgi:hypothetical protein
MFNNKFCTLVESYRSSTYKTFSRVLPTHYSQYSQVPMREYVWVESSNELLRPLTSATHVPPLCIIL